MKKTQWIAIGIGIGFLCVSFTGRAETIRIAAASDLQFAMNVVIKCFMQNNPTANQDKIDVIYGSSGKFYTQLMQGAPYDMFFSADITYPQKLQAQGLVPGQVIPYATGRIVLWRLKSHSNWPLSLTQLNTANIRHMAIANPKHAPYGQRAQEALTYAGVWQTIQPKLVFGENVVQAAQFVQTGHADVGMIALSIARSPTLEKVGTYTLIPENMHTPLLQGFVTTNRAQKSALAKQFANYMTSKTVQNILMRYGFELPTEADGFSSTNH